MVSGQLIKESDKGRSSKRPRLCACTGLTGHANARVVLRVLWPRTASLEKIIKCKRRGLDVCTACTARALRA